MDNFKIILLIKDKADSEVLFNTLTNNKFQVVDTFFSINDLFRKKYLANVDCVIVDAYFSSNFNFLKNIKMIQNKYYVPVVFFIKNINDNIFNKILKILPYGFIAEPIDPIKMKYSILFAINRHSAESAQKKKEIKNIINNRDSYSFMNSVLHSLLIVNLSGRIVFANNNFLKLLKTQNVDEIIGKDINKYFVLKKTIFEVIKSIKSSGSLKIETYLMLDSGIKIDVLLMISGVSDKNNNLKSLIYSCEDLTDKKKQYEKLIRSEEKYRNILENAIDIVFIVDRQGEIDFINRKVFRNFNNKNQRRNIFDFILPQYHNIIRKRIEEVFRFGSSDKIETKALGVDNISRYYEIRFSCLNMNDSKKQAIGIMRDITIRKSIEDELKKSEEKYKNIFIAAPISIIVIDKKGVVIDINPYHFKNLEKEKINKDEYIYENILSNRFVSRFKIRNNIKMLLKGKSFEEKNIIIQWDDLEEGFYNITGVPIFKLKKPNGAIIVIEDITVQRNAKNKLRSSLQEKEILLKEIHHRVKNNMQIILSLLSLQVDKIKDQKASDIFKNCQEQVKAMALVHNSLYHSKDLSKIDFKEYTRYLLQQLFFSYSVNPREIKLDISIDDVYLSVDVAIPCSLIINEIVTNSLKYAFVGKTKGIVRIELLNYGERHNCLVISDNGVGFPKGYDPVHPNTLGLKLVNALSRQLKAELVYEGKHGVKYKFIFMK